jgi:kynurenine formamidase
MKISNYLFATSLVLLGCEAPKEQKPEFDQGEDVLVDLSHPYSSETIYWVTARQFDLDTVFAGTTDKGYYYSAYDFTTAEHGGTHLDAPIHFASGRQTVDEVPLEKLIGPAILIDLRDSVDQVDYLISIDDLKKWESIHGKIPDGSIVLLYTGHSAYYNDVVKYLGTDQRGEDAVAQLHFPGLNPDAASWLVENRNINAIGIDTPSIDYGQSSLFQSHVILLSENIPVFENLTNMEGLPPDNFEVLALPMKIEGGSGAPLRIVARYSRKP